MPKSITENPNFIYYGRDCKTKIGQKHNFARLQQTDPRYRAPEICWDCDKHQDHEIHQIEAEIPVGIQAAEAFYKVMRGARHNELHDYMPYISDQNGLKWCIGCGYQEEYHNKRQKKMIEAMAIKTKAEVDLQKANDEAALLELEPYDKVIVGGKTFATIGEAIHYVNQNTMKYIWKGNEETSTPYEKARLERFTRQILGRPQSTNADLDSRERALMDEIQYHSQRLGLQDNDGCLLQWSAYLNYLRGA